jgi:hypothetical protein
MANQATDQITGQIVDFISSIGIEVRAGTVEGDTFLPGILVEGGSLVFDEAKLTYPGDLLHEAGHLALASGDVRPGLSGEVVLPGVSMEPVESGAMAWSYAAILHIGLPPEIVFHPGGYRGAADALLLNFRLGVYAGANILQDAGLTVAGQKAAQLGVEPYPYMIKWLRD